MQKIAGVEDGSLDDTGSIDACLSFPTYISAPSRLESSLLEVLQMDFEVEELSTPLDSQVIVWKLELPVAPAGVAKTEGAMRIYTTQRDFVGLAPLVMVSWPAAAAPRRVTPHQRQNPAAGRRAFPTPPLLSAENTAECTLLPSHSECFMHRIVL